MQNMFKLTAMYPFVRQGTRLTGSYVNLNKLTPLRCFIACKESEECGAASFTTDLQWLNNCFLFKKNAYNASSEHNELWISYLKNACVSREPVSESPSAEIATLGVSEVNSTTVSTPHESIHTTVTSVYISSSPLTSTSTEIFFNESNTQSDAALELRQPFTNSLTSVIEVMNGESTATIQTATSSIQSSLTETLSSTFASNSSSTSPESTTNQSFTEQSESSVPIGTTTSITSWVNGKNEQKWGKPNKNK
jgi:hypothetical protein